MLGNSNFLDYYSYFFMLSLNAWNMYKKFNLDTYTCVYWLCCNLSINRNNKQLVRLGEIKNQKILSLIFFLKFNDLMIRIKYHCRLSLIMDHSPTAFNLVRPCLCQGRPHQEQKRKINIQNHPSAKKCVDISRRTS